MEPAIVNTYQFSLIDSNSENTFLALSANVDSFLKKCEGFRYRSLTKVKSNEWLDILYWADELSAQKANARFLQYANSKQFLSLIKEESVKMQTAKLTSENRLAA